MADIVLAGKQPVFVAEFVANELAGNPLTLHEVAVKAGYAERSASVTASQLLADPKIQLAISERKRLLAEQAAGSVDVDAKRVLREWAEIAVGDPTAVVTVRRFNCRHCWGHGHAYQWDEREYAEHAARALQNGDEPRDFAGGFGWVRNADPNPDCPECSGEGLEDMTIADFRRLTPAQRRLIAGVKMGKHGIEVQFRDQDKALQNLAGYLGLVVDRKEHSGPGGGPIQTANVNYTLPTDPAEASRLYQQIMEGKV